MKKKLMIWIGIMLLLMSSVLAYERSEIDLNKVDTELAKEGIENKDDREKLINTFFELSEEDQQRIAKKCLFASNRVQCLSKDKVVADDEEVQNIISKLRKRGIERALEVVKNEKARSRLEENLVKIQEQKGIIFEEVEIEDEDTFTTKRKVKFLGFIPVTAKTTFDVDENGEITKEKKNIWGRIFN